MAKIASKYDYKFPQKIKVKVVVVERFDDSIITHVVIEDDEMFLLSIYDKSDKENISDSEILKRLKEIKNM